jgi:hypothetical protein
VGGVQTGSSRPAAGPAALVVGFAAAIYVLGTMFGAALSLLPDKNLFATGKEVNVFYGYLIGAALMIAAGVAEWLIGVEAMA